MKMKVLALTLMIVFSAMLIVPALAVSPKKIPVTISPSDFTFTPGVVTVTGNMQHCKDMTQGFGKYIVTGGGITLEGYSEGTGDYNININNNKGSIQYDVNIVFPDGTFVGKLIGHGTFGFYFGYPYIVEGTLHLVAQGTDDYSSWTLTYTQIDGQFVNAELLIP